MSTRSQLLVASGLVVVASAVTWIALRGGADRPEAASTMEGHDHAAMVAAGGDEARPVRLDPEAARRIGVAFATVVREPLERSVRTVGTVMWDETRLVEVTPKVEGWVERLHVDFTGAPVRRGEPLVDLYSPELVAAQEELILARKLLDGLSPDQGRAYDNARTLLDAARRRLGFWDVSDAEIEQIEQVGTPSRTVTLRAPATGIVFEKPVVEGARVMPGMAMFRIGDLRQVWVEGDIYEKDLSLVHEGQHAEVTVEAYPGESFHGRVAYVHPTVSVTSRTGRVRIELDNPDLRLKPGMYASLTLEAAPARAALLVPRDAVHFTGERALVFVQGENGVLEPREVTTGIAVDRQIEVLAGLSEGEIVVASANFLIDAESNMGSAMGGMPGMDMGAPAPEPPAAPEGMDHSQHVMPAPPDTGDTTTPPGMDHSQHMMPAAPDTGAHRHDGPGA